MLFSVFFYKLQSKVKKIEELINKAIYCEEFFWYTVKTGRTYYVFYLGGMDVEKARLRQIGLANLKWLHEHPVLKEQKEKKISQTLFNDPVWKDAETIAITKPMDFEFDTHILLNQGWQEEKRMLMPITGSERQLTFHLVTPETIFKKTTFGVEEPINTPEVSADIIDLLVVPGIVFTHEGFRIGFGGGFYDRFLQQYQGETCSLVFSEQIQESWQVESFDLPVKQLFIN